MSDSWLDRVPSAEREKIRKRMRSPEAYEALREKVKGPEDLEREMERNTEVAELKFALETEPALREALQEKIAEDLQEEGIEGCVDVSPDKAQINALKRGFFTVDIAPHPQTQVDQLVIVPDGKVQESLPLKPALSDRYVSQFATSLNDQ